MSAAVRQGLVGVMTLPIHSAYAEATAGLSRLYGPSLRAEFGIRPHPGVSLFGFGQWDKLNPQAGVGARWEMKW